MKLIVITGLILFNSAIYADDHLEKGIQQFHERKLEQAKSFFEDVLDENEQDAEAWYWLGRTNLGLRDHDEALDCFDEAIDLDENNAEYHFQRGNALGIKTQNSMVIKQAWLAPKVLKAFEKAIELDPTHIGGHVGAANFYLQAPGIMGGDLEKAKEQAKILLELDEFQGRMLLIAIYQKEDKVDLAEKEFENFDLAHIDSTGNYGFYNASGYFFLRHKKYEKAIAMFKKQVEMAPDQANPYDSLGDGYKAAGKYNLAREAYQKALEIDPDFEAPKKNLEELQKHQKE